MSDVDQMIEYAAMALLDCDEEVWDRMPQERRTSVEAEVEDVLKSLGLPLETLAALKAGTLKAMPEAPTPELLTAAKDLLARVYTNDYGECALMTPFSTEKLEAAIAKAEQYHAVEVIK